MPDRWTDAEQALRDALNKRPRGESPGGGLPPVPRAPGFRQEPEVIGGPELQQAVAEMLRVAPELRGQVKSVGYPVTSSVIHDLQVSGLKPENVEYTNLMGSTGPMRSPGPKSVFINPNLSGHQDDLRETVGHEMGHAVGYGEKDATRLEALVRKALAAKLRAK